ncbi:MAG: hypothetical protein JST00_41025 [Deltaproteobacteria bacterium]|nr:hypothetical protein [Deltaproteobacteria bacterium]
MPRIVSTPGIVRGVAACALALLGCRPSTPTVRADPVDATPDVAPPAPPKAGVRERWALVKGRVVDLDAPATTHTLSTSVVVEAWHGDRGYVVDKGELLTAYDLPSGKASWSAHVPHVCRTLVAGARWVYCVDEAKVTAFATKDGAVSAVPKPTPAWAAVVETPMRTLLFGAAIVAAFDPALAPSATTPLTSVGYTPRPFATTKGPCFADRSAGIRVTCLDEAGTLRHVTSFPLTPKAGASFPLDTVHRTDPNGPVWLMHSATFGPVGPAILLELPAAGVAPTKALEVVEQALAPALREDGGLEGLVVRRGKTIALLDDKGATRWVAKVDPFGETGHAVVVGDTVVVAVHSPIASGCALIGLHRTTGALLYQADVLQLPIAHSAYLNDVELEIRGKLVRLSGHEAGIRYEQLFDAATGKRLYAEAQLRW